MEPPTRACSCGSPASDSEVEAGSSPRSPPKAERSRKRPGGLDRAPPESPPSPRGGKRSRKAEGGDVPPSDGDRLFAQKVSVRQKTKGQPQRWEVGEGLVP